MTNIESAVKQTAFNCKHEHKLWLGIGFVVRANTNNFVPESFFVNGINCSIVLVNNISGKGLSLQLVAASPLQLPVCCNDVCTK